MRNEDRFSRHAVLAVINHGMSKQVQLVECHFTYVRNSYTRVSVVMPYLYRKYV
jgi:hypothetical protein